MLALALGALWLWWASLDKNQWTKTRRRVGKRFSEAGMNCRKFHEEDDWMDDGDLKDLVARGGRAGPPLPFTKARDDETLFPINYSQ